MDNDEWIRNLDERAIQYILALQEINNSLIKTLKAYGRLLRNVSARDDNYEEIKKAIDNIDRLAASAEKVNLFGKIERH